MAMVYFPPRSGRHEPVYFYDTPSNHPVTLSGFRILQKGRAIHSWKGTAEDLDRISRVPVIGEKTNLEMRNLFGAGNIAWQRELNIARTTQIQTWWGGNQNRLLNAAVVFLKTDAQATINTVNHLDISSITLDPIDWVFDQCPQCGWTPGVHDPAYANWYADVCMDCGHCDRPAFIVDGQHRIRGTAKVPMVGGVRTSALHNEPLVATFALSSDNFSTDNMAKIFSEITGTAEGLEALHAQFLRMKYSIGSLRTNERNAYRIAAEMNNRGWWRDHVPSTGPAKYGRVKMLKVRRARGDYIDIHAKTTGLQNYVEAWLDGSVVLDPAGTISDNADRLETYLDAVLGVWPPTAATGNWNRTRAITGHLQEKSTFRVLLSLFELITTRLVTLGRPLTAAEYTSQLQFFEPIEWSTLKLLIGQDGPRGVLDRVLSIVHGMATPADFAAGKTIPARAGAATNDNFNRWINGAPDTPSITTPTYTAGSRTLSFSITCPCPMVPDDPTAAAVPPPVVRADRPVNSYSAVECVVSNTTLGTMANTKIDSPSGACSFVLVYDDPAFAINPGDSVDFSLRFRSINNQVTTVNFTVVAA